MSTITLVRDDFRNVRRSYTTGAIVLGFTVIVASVFLAETNNYPDAYRTLWDVSALIAFVFPLFVAPLAYLSIAGDIARGSITYALGLPNTRSEYFLAKYVSRASVAVAAVTLAMLVGFAVAATQFENGADPVRFALFTAASALYALAITGLFVALSGLSKSRTRVMFAVLAVYFVLVPFWNSLIPVVNLSLILDSVETLTGLTIGESARDLVQVLSPSVAYLQSTQVVYAGVFDQYETFDTFSPDSTALGNQPWFAVVVLAVWAVGAPLAGYASFRSRELA